MRTFCFLVSALFSTFVSFANSTPGLKFIENKNQWNKEALYRAEVHGGFMFLKPAGFSFVFIDRDKEEEAHGQEDLCMDDSGDMNEPSTRNGWHVSLSFLAANLTLPVCSHPTGETYNYFIGDDRSNWGEKAQAFADVTYPDFYDCIDLHVYSSGPHAKYDFIVKPGANPLQIQWRYEGANSIAMEDGNLYAHTPLGDVIERKPYAYQFINDQQVEIPIEFYLKGTNVRYYFPTGYDECYELIIDPILIFSAYSGSISDNWGNTATYDSEGNTYSGGIVSATAATGFPSTTGAFQVRATNSQWDIGILKYDSSGSTLLYATYLGGNGVETPQSLVVDNDDNLLILGATSSSNFPVSTGAEFKGGIGVDPLSGITYSTGSDIFIAKLSKEGNALLAATLFGGTKNDGINFISGNMGTNQKEESPLARNYGDQLRGDIIVGRNNTVLIASNTLSNDLPAAVNSFVGGSHDAVVASFNSMLEINWSRYLGGSNTDAAYSIKVKENTLLVAGGTQSADFQFMNGYKESLAGNVDGWIAELSLDGLSIVNATYLGTNSYDQVYFIDINEEEEVYAFGQTQGEYPIQGDVYKNINGGQFIHKLSNDLHTSLLSTVIGTGGRSPNISPTAFLVSDCDYLYLSGWGGAINLPQVQTTGGAIINRNYVGGNTLSLPTTSDGYQRTTSGNDFYFMVLSADASEFLYGTFLGGSTSRTHVDGGTSRFDKQGVVYHAVCAGCGGQSDFPAINVPLAHRSNKSANCNNAVFKFDLSLLSARLQTNNITKTMPNISSICLPDKLVFQNKSSGGEIFEWNLGDGSPVKILSDTASFEYAYTSPGTYTVTLTAIDQGTCKVRDVATKVIRVFESVSQVQEDIAICGGESYQLQASGGLLYDWTSANAELIADLPMPHINPIKSTEYYVRITEASGCIKNDTVYVEVIPLLVPEFELTRQASCLVRPIVLLKNPQADSTDYTFTFDFGDGETSDLDEVTHAYKEDGTYTITLRAQREFCVQEKTQQVDILSIFMPNVLTPLEIDGKNDVFTLLYGSGANTPATKGLKVKLLIYNRWGNTVFETDDYQYDWSGVGLSSGVYFYEVTIEGYATCKDWIHLIK